MPLPFEGSEHIEPPIPCRICNKCMQHKPLTDFANDKGRRDEFKRHPVCKSCMRLHTQTVQRIKKTAPPKPSVCECCGRNPDTDRTIRGWAMDHNHSTHEFRGWICQTCNIGLGHFKDSVNGLLNAIIYLKKSEKRTNDETK